MAAPVVNSFALGMYQTNCFVVTPGPAEPESPCWIVDCGYEPRPLLDFIEAERLRPVAILLTHCHSDHIAGVDQALTRFGQIPMYVHEAEAGWCSSAELNLSALLGMPMTVTEPGHLLHGGEELALGDSSWRVIHTPGHSPGGVCYLHDASDQAIVGDTLFAGSIGRFDFPTSEPQALRRSIMDTILALPDATTIFPGHGPSSTIGEERRSNPFVLHGF